jgi:hypothetical protein
MKRFERWRWRISGRAKEPYEERKMNSFDKDKVKIFTFMVRQRREFMSTISVMCLDENEGVHLHMCVGFFSTLKWDFLHFPIIGLQGQ